jgi:hypothetical protein
VAKCSYSATSAPPAPRARRGFPVTARRLARRKRRVGECWSSTCTATGQATIVSPTLSEPVEILAVLLHELIHASVGPDCGHLAVVTGELDPFPHAALDAHGPDVKRQKCCLRLYECSGCGQKIRAATDTLRALHLRDDGSSCGIFMLK